MNKKILTACAGIFVWLMVLVPTGEAGQLDIKSTQIEAKI